MEDRALFIAYLVAWLVYVVAIHGYAMWKRLAQRVVVLSHAAPSSVAMAMAYIFLVERGATVRQYVACSQTGMDLWSLWVRLWPLLLLATSGTGFVLAGWAVAIFPKRQLRPWLPVAILGAGMCIFSFMTVLANFPDA